MAVGFWVSLAAWEIVGLTVDRKTMVNAHIKNDENCFPPLHHKNSSYLLKVLNYENYTLPDPDLQANLAEFGILLIFKPIFYTENL